MRTSAKNVYDCGAGASNMHSLNGGAFMSAALYNDEGPEAVGSSVAVAPNESQKGVQGAPPNTPWEQRRLSRGWCSMNDACLSIRLDTLNKLSPLSLSIIYFDRKKCHCETCETGACSDVPMAHNYHIRNRCGSLARTIEMYRCVDYAFLSPF